MEKYKCPCCGYFTLSEEPPGTFEICPVCYWEDDNVQFNDPTYPNGANEICLEDAKKNYLEYGAISKEFMKRTRKPVQEEMNA